MSSIDTAIAEIELAIIANGNEEITADVLRPLLVGLGNAVESITGDPINLNTTATNLVAAINEVLAGGASGITIHTGTADPNVTPPLSYNLGDFYSRYVLGVLISFWQYNGIEWIEIKSQLKEIIVTSLGNLTVKETDHTIIYADGVTSNDLTLGIASNWNKKILKIVNRDSSVINLDVPYVNYSEAEISTVPINSSITIQSDGTNWNLI